MKKEKHNFQHENFCMHSKFCHKTFVQITNTFSSLQIFSSFLISLVLAAPQHNNYNRESAKVLELSQDHWSALNPHKYGPDYSHELQGIWDSLLVNTKSTSSFLILIFT